MLGTLFNDVLPVFAIVAIGFVAGRTKLFDVAAATAVNRFVFYFALPALVFRLISSAPISQFEWKLLLAYLIAEIVLYAVGFAVARFAFRRTPVESLLLGMSTAYVNHVFLILPLARELFGNTAALPIVAIITIDSIVVLAGTVLILDATSERAAGVSIQRLFLVFAKNPQILGIFAGIAANLAGIHIGGGFDFFLHFLGEAAAPCALFALGVILITQKDAVQAWLPIAMTALKLLLMPAVAWLLISATFGISAVWADPALLVAAGPAGMMSFVLALQYDVPVAAIARTILISTLVSLLTLSAIIHYV